MQLFSTLLFVGLVSASALKKGGQQSAAYLVGRGFVLRDLQSRQNICENNSGASNCQEYCGAEWTSCATENYCYNPTVHVCCSNGWHCDSDHYCIDGNRCCPNGNSLEECDATESISTIGGPATAPPSESTPEPGTVVTTPESPIITPTPETPIITPTPVTPGNITSAAPVPPVPTTINPPIVTAGAAQNNLAAIGGFAALLLAL